MSIYETITILATIIGIPAMRSAAGWINISLKDYDKKIHGWKFWKAIQPFEVEQLITTEFRIIVGGLAAYFGFNMFNLDINLISSIVGIAFVDWVSKTYKNK